MREIVFALGYMPHRIWGSVLQAQILEKEKGKESNQAVSGRCQVFHDHHQDLRPVQPLENISAREFLHLSVGVVVLSLYLFRVGAIYEYERGPVYHIDHDFHDGPDFRTDYSDAIREK